MEDTKQGNFEIDKKITMKDLKTKFSERFQHLKSNLTVGLDPEWNKIPEFLKKEEFPLFIFCKEIIDATGEFALAFKPNIAFFERFGSKGIQQFEMAVEYMKHAHPSAIIIADAKRGDLANTAKEYAAYYFQSLELDSLTISPYMGKDTIIPYLENNLGSVFVLCLTSNPSALEFQKWKDDSRPKQYQILHEAVAHLARELNQEYKGRVGIVVGGTRPSEIAKIRSQEEELLFLIPGFGAQGGSLEEIMEASGEFSFINSSRGIHFLSGGRDFADLAHAKAKEITQSMRNWYSIKSKN